MRSTEHDGSMERSTLIGMITCKDLLSKVAPKWEKDGLFHSRWSNLIGGWCVRYYKKYGDVPCKRIENVFASWAARNNDKESTALIDQFLSSLSDDYEGTNNPGFQIDTAGSYFNKVRAEKLRDSIDGHLSLGDVSKAEEAIRTYRRIEIGVNSFYDLLQDEESCRASLDDKMSEPLIEYPGALGEFYGESLSRDAFVSFLAPEKRGKTFFLMDLAWEGMLRRRRVVFFQVGDLTKNQMWRRFMIRAAQRPYRPRKVKFPIAIAKVKSKDKEKNKDKIEMVPTFEEKSFEGYLDYETAWKAVQDVVRHGVRSNDSYLKLYACPSGSITAYQIRALTEDLAAQGWPPDVIIIDYADILRMDNTRDIRERTNETWQELRALSQSLHCLVVTATQANRQSYKSKVISMEHSSEDKRKMAHVTGMIGLSQTSDEKLRQMMRLNWVVLREQEFSTKRCVHLAQCLSLARPVVCSSF